MADLTRQQANDILQRAKHYAQTGNMREAMNSVLSDFQNYGVGSGFIDILILGEAKNIEELEKALKGYCFWPK
jgi:hypothetical protein